MRSVKTKNLSWVIQNDKVIIIGVEGQGLVNDKRLRRKPARFV